MLLDRMNWMRAFCPQPDEERDALPVWRGHTHSVGPLSQAPVTYPALQNSSNDRDQMLDRSHQAVAAPRNTGVFSTTVSQVS